MFATMRYLRLMPDHQLYFDSSLGYLLPLCRDKDAPASKIRSEDLTFRRDPLAAMASQVRLSHTASQHYAVTAFMKEKTILSWSYPFLI